MKKISTETVGIFFMRFVTYFVVAVVGWILLDIIIKGIPGLSWEFISTAPRRSGAEGGILPAIVGTIYLLLGTLIIALPLGIATAIYLSEYAQKGRFVNYVRRGIITLAGVPSIVFGLFGLGLFVIYLNFGASILSGSLTLACMTLPTIIVASEEALKSVPRSFREASLALGATKWETIKYNVLPYSIPGMLTGSILAIGRAAGETAPILLTVAAFYLPRFPSSVFDQVMVLPYHLYILATQHPEAALIRDKQYGTALVLLIIVLGFNLVAVLYRRKFKKKYQWN